jgi:hypothetical protein
MEGMETASERRAMKAEVSVSAGTGIVVLCLVRVE